MSTNLLTNSLQALEERPQPRRVRLSARADAEWAHIEVADNGPGIEEAVRSRVFDPFFTTKSVGAGTGIGLAASRGIVEAHGGSLRLALTDEEGACFVILSAGGRRFGALSPTSTAQSERRQD